MKRAENACEFFYRIRKFLEGEGDPCWRKQSEWKQTGVSAKQYYWHDQEKRSEKVRAKRFLEVLKTIDGIFIQLFQVSPNLKWTWEKYEELIPKLIWILLTDEFLDGDVT